MFSTGWLGTTSCYRPPATLPQENPLVWGPPLQHSLPKTKTEIHSKTRSAVFHLFNETKISQNLVPFGFTRGLLSIEEEFSGETSEARPVFSSSSSSSYKMPQHPFLFLSFSSSSRVIPCTTHHLCISSSPFGILVCNRDLAKAPI